MGTWTQEFRDHALRGVGDSGLGSCLGLWA